MTLLLVQNDFFMQAITNEHQIAHLSVKIFKQCCCCIVQGSPSRLESVFCVVCCQDPKFVPRNHLSFICLFPLLISYTCIGPENGLSLVLTLITPPTSSSRLLQSVSRSCNLCRVMRKLPGSLSDATPRPVSPLCACERCACSFLSKTQVALVACMPPLVSFFHLLHCTLLSIPSVYCHSVWLCIPSFCWSQLACVRHSPSSGRCSSRHHGLATPFLVAAATRSSIGVFVPFRLLLLQLASCFLKLSIGCVKTCLWKTTRWRHITMKNHTSCKYSQLHPNAFLTTSTTNTTTNTTITLQHDSTQHDNGLALGVRVILDSGAHWSVQAGHPTVHRCQKGQAVGGPQLVPRQTCFQQTGVKTHVRYNNQVPTATWNLTW